MVPAAACISTEGRARCQPGHRASEDSSGAERPVQPAPNDPSNAVGRGVGVCVLCSCNTCLGAATAMQGLRGGVHALGKRALRRRVLRHGDRVHVIKPAGNVMRMIFKAFEKP